jgi:hypothetical protein
MYCNLYTEGYFFQIEPDEFNGKFMCINVYQGRPNGRSRMISELIILEFIFRPRARKLIVVVMNKLSIVFICIVFIFYSDL